MQFEWGPEVLRGEVQGNNFRAQSVSSLLVA